MHFMHFVLSTKLPSALENLDSDYEKLSGKDLEKSPQPYAISCLFGAKNIESRRGQIAFIKKWLVALREYLIITEVSDVSKPTEIIQNYLTALRVLMTICFYIKSKISNNCILDQLLNKAAGVSPTNPIDQETIANCLLAAKRYLKGERRLEAVNAKIQQPFSEQEWQDLIKFVKDQCALLDKKQIKNYPITSIVKPLIAGPLELLGWSVGYVMGDTMSHIPPVRYTLTAALGGGAYLLVGSSASVCMIILAPAVASRILDTFCGLTLAFVMGKSLKLVGEGVGFGIGMPLDISCQLIGETLSTLTTLYHYSKSGEKLSGISLVDGHLIQDGIDLMLVNLSHLPAQLTLEHKEHLTQFETGEFEIGEDEIIVTIGGKNTRVPLVTELQTHLSITPIEEMAESTALQLE